MLAQPWIEHGVNMAENARHQQAERHHEVPAERRELETHLQKQGKAADQQNRDGNRGNAKERPEGGHPERQALGRFEHLHGGGTQAEVGKEHAAHPDDDTGHMQEEQELVEHGCD